jgi:fumarylacetoacetate (FAA) hydrolase family protein
MCCKRKDVSLFNNIQEERKYMERVVFNPAQREVLDVMSCMQTDEDLQALKAVLVQFLNDRLQKELNRLWDNGTIDETKMNEWRNTHYRTPYRQ